MLVWTGLAYARSMAMIARLKPVQEEHDSARELGRDKLRSLAKIGLVLLGITAAILLLMWSEGSERRAIRDMPPSERQALLSRTLENLKSVCAEPEDAMRGFCGDQARLVLEFPECDDACQSLARRQLSRVPAPR
jgi:hypothetical protein